MKSRKFAVIISAVVMVISLIIFAIMNFLSCKNDWVNFFFTIGSGAFTSSLVTLLISITEYRIERQSALEDFAKVNIHFCADFYNMKYLYLAFPLEWLQGYYAEQRKFPFESENQTNYGERIKEYLWNTLNVDIQKEIIQNGGKEKYLEKELECTIKKYNDEIDAIIKQYVVLDEKVSSRELTSAIGKIDFLFGNEYRKEVLHGKIYEKQREVINILHDKCYHFKNRYKSDNVGTFPVMLGFIKDLQEYFFTVNTKENEIVNADIVYNQYLFDINSEIDNLLRNLYGEKKYAAAPPKLSDYKVVEHLKSISE